MRNQVDNQTIMVMDKMDIWRYKNNILNTDTNIHMLNPNNHQEMRGIKEHESESGDKDKEKKITLCMQKGSIQGNNQSIKEKDKMHNWKKENIIINTDTNMQMPNPSDHKKMKGLKKDQAKNQRRQC